MATLIQSKQIEGVVTASVITGDFTVQSGSVDLTSAAGVTGSFSGSFVGDGTGLTINYSQLQGKPNFKAGTGIAITQVGSDITITNTGGGGGVSGSAELLNSVALLNAYSASNNLVISGINQTTASLQAQIDALNVPATDLTSLNQFTSSVTTRIDNIEQQVVGRIDNIETFTQSIDSRVTALENQTDNTGSDSQTLTIVGDKLTISGGNTVTIPTGSGSGTSDFTQLTNVPSGLISSSQQISDLGFIDTQHTDISALNTFTSSAESRLSALESATGSYLTSETDSQTLSIVGDQLTISSGNTITIPTGSGGTTDISALNSFTSSADTRITNLENFSSSLDSTFATDSELSSLSSSIATTIDNIQHTQIPSGTISGSSQVDITQTSGYNTFSASIQSTIDSIQHTQIPSGVISGSTFTDFSSSVESRLSTLEGQTDLTGSDTQSLSIVGDQLTISGGNTITIPTGSTLPSGLISSSQQISDFGYVTSSLEAPFNGDRVVSNTLLGELYSQSYNAGTTGSLAEFIEQVFFPVTAPTAEFTDQTAKFNTNLATNNTNLVSVSLTDTVDNSPYTLVLSGIGASSLLAVPTNAESSSWEIRANGDLTAGTYSYNVTVGDSTDATRVYSGRSITIAQASNGTLTTNGTFYIIESATSGVITLSTSGRPGSAGSVSATYSPNYGSQVATNFTSSNPLISLNSTTGQLSVGSPISGSGNLAGSVITSNITFEDQYGNVGSGSISVNVTQNSAPQVSNTQVSNNNTNQARNTNLILQLLITDVDGDTIPNSGLVFSGYNTTYFSENITTPYMQLRANSTNVPAGTYPYTASLTDEHGFRTREVNGTFTINSADDGTLSGDTSIYIIESATSGDSFRDATGFGNGNLANISVSYSPNYGSQVATLTSSNPAIVVDGSGNLTLGVDLSGSVTQSGDSFTSLISWEDQYGNQDSTTITATVFGNQSPSATFTDNGLTDVTAVNGANIGSLSITDTESNSPFQVTIGGTDGSKFNLVAQNDASSSWQVQPNQSLPVGDYSVQFTVTDSYSEQAILNETISVTSDSDYGVTYVYTNNRGIGSLSLNYLGVLAGAASVNGDTPPEITSYSDNSIIDYLAGNLGSSEIDMGSGFNLTQRLLDSGSDLGQILSGSDSFVVNPNEQILIIFPSGSDMIGIPTSIGQTFGGSTVGEYVLNVNTGAGWSSTIEGANIHSFQTDSPVNGYSEYFIIGTTVDGGIGGTIELRLTPSSGSAPV